MAGVVAGHCQIRITSHASFWPCNASVLTVVTVDGLTTQQGCCIRQPSSVRLANDPRQNHDCAVHCTMHHRQALHVHTWTVTCTVNTAAMPLSTAAVALACLPQSRHLCSGPCTISCAGCPAAPAAALVACTAAAATSWPPLTHCKHQQHSTQQHT